MPAWAQEYVEAITEAGLIDGKAAAAFAPNDNMTRADLVLALYRLAGSPAVAQENVFTDVPDDAAYKNAVLWAYSKGIVTGATATAFHPTGGVKRQEIAKILDVFAATRAEVAVILRRYMDDASTGDAGRDNPRNGDNIGENELLVVSIGTSFNDSRVATIGAIENALEKAFPDYSVRRGFTANIIIEHVFRRDGEVIDGVKEALDRAVSNGVKNLLVQPTHLMSGYEYGDLCSLLEKKYADKFETISIGAPLLTSDEDFNVVAKAMVDATAGFDDGKTAICFMGHGTEAASNAIYNKMQSLIQAGGHANCFVGTVDETETANTLKDVIRLVKDGGYERVVLRPMMIAAGDHAHNDMAGGGDSWKNTFIAEGFAAENVICEIKGLGGIPAIQDLLVDHAKNARPLSAAGAASQPAPENPDNEEPDKEEPAGTAALDTELSYAAHGVKSGKWFARTLTFDSESIQ